MVWTSDEIQCSCKIINLFQFISRVFHLKTSFIPFGLYWFGYGASAHTRARDKVGKVCVWERPEKKQQNWSAKS